MPGVGPATVTKFRENGVTTQYQLIAKYMSMKDDDTTPIEHAERFYLWLVALDTPSGFRAGIVHAVCSKVALTYPELYDSDAWN